MDEPAAVIARVCASLSRGDLASARSVIEREYPFTPTSTIKRKYGPREATQVFIRDGFIDRYSGDRLLFPPVLRVLSAKLPTLFPYHPAWKTDRTHPAYMALSATVDHVNPVTLGGADDMSNWITTSMARNFAKQNTTLESLGWTLRPPGDFRHWDGMLQWFLQYADAHSEVLANASIRQWHRAGRAAISRGLTSA